MLLQDNLLLVSGGGGVSFKRSNGSVFDFECDSYAVPYTWSDGDAGTGVSSLDTVDGRDVFKHINGTDAGNNAARRISLTGETIPASLAFTVVQNIRVDHTTAAGLCGYVVRISSTATLLFGSYGGTIHVYGGGDAGWIDSGVAYVVGAWEEFTLDCDYSTEATATLDIYKGGLTPEASGVDCSHVGGGTWTEGEIWTYGLDTNIVTNPAYDVDRIIVGDGLVTV